jgi:hypothetical protein
MRKSSPFLIASILFITITAFSGCWSYYNNPGVDRGNTIRDEAYVPVYGIDTALRVVRSLAPQPVVAPGKIYVLGNNLFQVENMKGIHIINYSDRSKPEKISFIRIGGASELAVKNGFLVVNNGPDLVTVDVSDFHNAKEVGRVKNAFKTFYQTAWELRQPPEKGKYYVCEATPYGQDLIGWKLEKNVANANCYTYP